MKVHLIKRAKIWCEAGETVEVSPAEANFLLSVRAAELIQEPAPEKPKRKKKEG